MDENNFYSQSGFYDPNRFGKLNEKKRSISPELNVTEKRTQQVVQSLPRTNNSQIKQVEYHYTIQPEKDLILLETFWGALSLNVHASKIEVELNTKCLESFMKYWAETVIPILEKHGALTLKLGIGEDLNCQDVTIAKIEHGHYIALQLAKDSVEESELGDGDSFHVYVCSDLLSEHQYALGVNNDFETDTLLNKSQLIRAFVSGSCILGAYVLNSPQLHNDKLCGNKEIYVAPCVELGNLTNHYCGLSFDEGVKLAFEYINQIKKLHESGWVHRDLNIGNILVLSKAPHILIFTDLERIEKIDTEQENTEKDFEDAFEITLDIFNGLEKNDSDPKMVIEEIKEICERNDFDQATFNLLHEKLAENLPKEKEVVSREAILEKTWSCFEKPKILHDVNEVGKIIFNSCIKLVLKN